MTILRHAEVNRAQGLKSPAVINLLPPSGTLWTPSRFAISRPQRILICSLLLVHILPLLGQENGTGKPAASDSQSQATNPKPSVTGNEPGTHEGADKIDEIAHRVRLLEIKAAEKTTPWYASALVPLLTAIIGGLAVSGRRGWANQARNWLLKRLRRTRKERLRQTRSLRKMRQRKRHNSQRMRLFSNTQSR